jgi:hypothetical protein
MLISEQKAELFRRAAAGRGGELDGRPSEMGTGWWVPLYLLPGSNGCRTFIQKVEIGAITKNPPAPASGHFFDNTQPL